MEMNMPDGQGISFFGDLLKRFWQDKHLTQQHLAEKIGASRESISLWERGAYKPETTTMVHELARVLKLDEEEKRLLFEAHAGTASVLPLHNFPEHNSYFTGREEILNSLHAHLTAGKQVALIQTQAISGLVGIGKTQVAIEYAYRFREHYHDILWVAADSRERLMSSYLTLAKQLRLREREEREQRKVVEAVKQWLREHKHWLLILDNIEDLGLVREFVPSPRQGAVVLTTRRGETSPVAEALVLEDLPEEEAILFLLRRAGYVPKEAPLEIASAGDRTVALALVQTVGGLPLALDQAGAYVAETKCSLSDYLDLFKKRQKDLLDRRGTLAYEHPRSVVATFSLAFEQAQQHKMEAIDLLKFCAYVAPDAIPLEVVTEGAAHLGTVLETVANDALQLDHALEVLQAFSLVRRDSANHTLSIHRLVQAVLQDTLEESEHRAWAQRAVHAVNAAFPEVGFSSWSQCERYLPHVQVCATFVKNGNVASPQAALLLYDAGYYLLERARYEEAEPLIRQALTIYEQYLEAKHAEKAACFDRLARCYELRGEYAQAELFYQRALEIHEQWEPDHPNIGGILNNLALLYKTRGKFTEAEPLYRRALAVDEKFLGLEHPDVATDLNNLAVLYKIQGKYTEAEPLYRRALTIREQHLEGNHPDIAQSLNNLAGLLIEQGKYAEVEALLLRAQAIYEQALGVNHPLTAMSLRNLAGFYMRQGKYEQAEPLLVRSLSISEQRLEFEHPNTAKTLSNLAELYRIQKKYNQAEPLHLRALAIREKVLGSEHFEIAVSLSKLALLYRDQGKYEEAEPLLIRALAIHEKVFGFEHPDTAQIVHHLAQLWEAQGKGEAASVWYARALTIREQALGAQHPRTTETRTRLIALLHALGQHEQATQLEAAQADQPASEQDREEHPEE